MLYEMTIRKYIAALLAIIFLSCANQRDGKTPDMPPNDASIHENEELADPLILDGRPYVDSQRKAYRRDEAALIEHLHCDFNPDADVRWYSLEGVEQLVNLKGLSVDGGNFSKVDFRPLSPLSNLESLYFDGITHLPDLTMLEQQLRYIGIKDARLIRDASLESLEGIGAPNVRRISISNGGGMGIDSLMPLNNLSYLEDLYINGGGSTTLRIADISNLPSLKKLVFIMSLTSIDLQGIEKLSALERLWLSEANPFNIEGIGKLENLRELNLKLVAAEPSLEFLRDMPNLSHLTLGANIPPYQVLDLSPLATLKNLKSLGCGYFIIKNLASLDVLDSLSERPGLISMAGSQLYDETDRSRHYIFWDFPVK